MATKKRQYEEVSPTPIRVATPQHQTYIHALAEAEITLVLGPAGTGKTFIALASGLERLRNREIQKIVVIRYAQTNFSEDIGALPGDLLDKMAPFAGGALDSLRQLVGPALTQQYLADGSIEFLPVSWCLGRTFTNTFVLVDEIQQFSPQMILAVLTRLGQGSRMVLAGDPMQAVGTHSGITYARLLLNDLKSCRIVELSHAEVERHPLVRQILKKASSLNTPYH